MTKAEEIANVVVLLCSEKASYVTNFRCKNKEEQAPLIQVLFSRQRVSQAGT
nr:hypothetical protein [Thermotoga sp.]